MGPSLETSPPRKQKKRRKFRTPRAFKWFTRHPRLKTTLAWAVGAYLALAYRTTRWEFRGMEHVSRSTQEGKPGLVCFWHERLPMMPMLALHARSLGATMPTNVLVSGHNDGRFIGQAVGRFGLGTVVGSSSKGGSASLRSMLLLLQAGHNIAITPDGPRGPRRQAAAGVAQLAAATGTPIYPCAAQCRFHIRLPSWDRMALPLPIPFGRGVVVVEPPILVPRQNWATHLSAVVDALNAACAAADRACGLEPEA